MFGIHFARMQNTEDDGCAFVTGNYKVVGKLQEVMTRMVCVCMCIFTFNIKTLEYLCILRRNCIINANDKRKRKREREGIIQSE